MNTEKTYYSQLNMYKLHLIALETQYQFFKERNLFEDMRNISLIKKYTRLCRDNFRSLSFKIGNLNRKQDLSVICPKFD